MLLELLSGHGLSEPPHIEGIKELNPFAVLLRYDFVETEALNREQARAVVEAVRRWAGEQIK
jgi:hypothetical protein